MRIGKLTYGAEGNKVNKKKTLFEWGSFIKIYSKRLDCFLVHLQYIVMLNSLGCGNNYALSVLILI
jgi:hypothetical protein